MPDLEFKCVDCQKEFIFTEGEQSYYRDRGLAIPKRCSLCRLKRRKGEGRIEITSSVEKTKETPEVKDEAK